MERSILLHQRSLGVVLPCRKAVGASRRGRRSLAVMAKPNKAAVGVPGMTATTTATKKTVYHDGWFDRLAIGHLSESVQATSGMRNDKDGFESLIQAASDVLKCSAGEQQDLVLRALNRAFPAPVLDTIKFFLPPSKLSREFFAIFTTLFFRWLVGPCEVKESDFEGEKERNVVYIPKCRLLESTKCVAMCTNMCKVASEKFIHNSLGTPVYMIPNFEDMSCEMIFGQHPPADDPAMKQPCYRALCIAKQTSQVNCSK